MSKGEIQFLISFAAGMAAFWLSGKAAAALPVMPNHMLALISGIAVSALVYGLGAAVLAWLVLGSERSLKAVLGAGIVAIVLAEITAQALVPMAAGFVRSQATLAVLMFVLYLLFGLFYVLSNLVARRLA